jgi:hypothetical protein
MDRGIGDTRMRAVVDEFGTAFEAFPIRVPIVDQPNRTSIQYGIPVNADMSYNIQRMNSFTGTPFGQAQTVTIPASQEQKINDLIAGATYQVTLTPTSGPSAGNSQIQPPYTLPLETQGTFTPVKITENPKAITAAKSYMELSYNGTIKDQFALAFKSFSGMVLPTSSQASSSLPTKIKSLARNYTESYFTFGTSLFMDNNVKYPNQAGGLGFFISDSGKSGYFVLVETTASSASNDRKSIRIVKTTPDGIVKLADSQRSTDTTFDGLYGGKAYAIDVKVKCSGQSITINVYVNGFKITATDTNNFTNIKKPNFIVAPTKNVGLVSLKGKSLFDYVYATDITKEKYDMSGYDINLYQGQFSNDTLDVAYGNTLYNSNYADDEINKTKNAIEEFGSVVREILYVKQKFNSRPSFPIRWSTGQNKYAKVIGQKISSFGGEAYVLNNTSTTIPLSDGANAAFYVFGNDLGQSGTLEYVIDDTAEYNYKEPITFDSTWLQNEDDVKKLATWIKNKVVNKGKLLELSIFGNPLLEVGDIISVKHTYQGLNGTEKFIITNISHSYDQGLETSIVCRTL